MLDSLSSITNVLWAFMLGLLLVAGLASTRLTKRLRMPNVTGFLVIGIVLALIALGLDFWIGKGEMPEEGGSIIHELDLLNNIVASIALGFIALSIGEEFKLGRLKQYGGKIVLLTVLQSLMAGLLVGGFVLLVCYLMHVELYIALLLAAISTATAPAATLMVIQQYNANGPMVDVLLPVVAFDDAVGLIVFSIAVSVSKVMASGESIDWLAMTLMPLINILGSLLLGFVLGLLLKGTIRFFKSRHNHLMMLIAFTLLGTGACSLINSFSLPMPNGDTEFFEFSNLLTCMMIGATYINIGKDVYTIKRDFHLVGRWTPFLLLLFFVLSGSHLVTSAFKLFSEESADMTKTLIPTLVIFGVYLIARSVGKYFGAWLGCVMTKEPAPIRRYLGVTLLPQAGVAIGMANTIANIPEFNQKGGAQTGNMIITVVLCATLVYELLGPVLTKWALTKAGEINVAQEERPFGEFIAGAEDQEIPAGSQTDVPFAGNPRLLAAKEDPLTGASGAPKKKKGSPGKKAKR